VERDRSPQGPYAGILLTTDFISYGWNYIALDWFDYTLPGIYNGQTANLRQITQPAHTIIVADSSFRNNAYVTRPSYAPEWGIPYGTTINIAECRHRNRGNFLFADFHVENLPPEVAVATNALWKMKQ
jgi:prepilin-type processing-associated H-X9-DG protein